MTTIVRRPEPPDLEVLEGMLMGTYLDGECYALALALSRGLGWPIFGLMQGDEIRHAAVQSPDGQYWDARGKIDRMTLGKPFGNGTLARIEEADLYRTRRILDLAIYHARTLAERLWPELPWKEPCADRIKRYVDELEALSRKHGLWIAARFPGAPPMIVEGEGDEKGYVLSPNMASRSFFVDRML